MFKRLLVMFLAVLISVALIPKDKVLAAETNVYTFDEIMQLYKNGKGVNIVPDDWDKTFTTEIQDSAGLVVTPLSSSDIASAAGSVSKAVRMQTTAVGSSAWSSQVYVKLNPGVKKGDIVFFGFKMKGIESITDKEARGVLANTRLRVDGKTSVNLNVSGTVSDEWKQCFMAAESPVDSDESGGKFVFQLGMAVQTIDIADVFAIDFGQGNVNVSQFPIMKTTYKGMEDDAQWRKDALERIDKIRKADISVKVKDKNGKLIPNAEVTVNQTKHAYGFGSIVNAIDYFNFDVKTQTKYLDTLKMIAERSGFENEMKMNYIAANAEKIDYFLKWFKKNGMDVRGHVLIYGQWSRLTPEQKIAMIENPQLLKDYTLEHIKKYVTLYKGEIYNWDTVNENMTANDFTTILGDEVIDDWFKEAHKADPDAKLTYNDYGALSNNKIHEDYDYDLCKSLIDRGVPITTIGIQAHMSLIPPEDILTTLDRFASLGKEIEITEFTFASDDTEIQAKYTRDFLIAAFSSPATTSIVTWGFWEGSLYDPKAAMFNKDFSIKPNGKVWMDLIYNKWWTNEKGATDASGNYNTRAFLGDHKVTVNVNGNKSTFDISLDKDGKLLNIVYDNGSFKLVNKDIINNTADNNQLAGENTTSMISKKSSSGSSGSASSDSKPSTTKEIKNDSNNKSNEETIPLENWQNTEQGWKYVKNGNPVIGWNQVNGDWYLMDSTGVMQTGWKKISDTWYLLKNNGVMATGWQEVNGKWYYLYSNGSMGSNTVIQGYRLDENGAWS